MTVPGIIRIERSGSAAQLWVDGQEFPWAIARDGLAVDVDTEDAPSVGLRLIADRVEVVDDFAGDTSLNGSVA